jgi:hypothetical protein
MEGLVREMLRASTPVPLCEQAVPVPPVPIPIVADDPPAEAV